MNPVSTSTTTVASTGSAPGARGRHVVLRHRLSIDGAGVALIGGGFFVVVLSVTAIASIFNEVRISGWEQGTQLIRWFVGGIGVYLSAVYLPLYVTHGRTRREVATDSALFGAIYAVLVGSLITAGYALEGVVYRLVGWTQGLESTHLFDAPDQYLLILAEHGLVMLVWVAAGALLGAGFYRGGGLGMLLLPVGLAPVLLIETTTGPGYFGPLPPPLLELVGFAPEPLSVLGAAGTALVSAAILTVATWFVIRDLPIRGQTP